MDAVLGLPHPPARIAVGRGQSHREFPGDSRCGALSLRGVTRRFGGTLAVDHLSLDIAQGELLALVGASGSGKTTTLRMVAGYEPVDEGSVMLDGRDMTTLPPQRRDFGMVFQHYALFPHLTVEQNVAFGLEARRVTKTERLVRARAMLETVGLGGAGGRAVQSLSGGEQQRVALARALVIEPRVLLLDEPLSNLDPTLRQTMRDELRAILRRQRVTALFVTHDQEDAFAVGDRIALMRHGRLLQVGSPETLYHTPATRAVAAFVGHATLVPARLDNDRVRISIGGVERIARLAAPRQIGGPVLAVLRPEMLGFAASEDTDVWPGVVRVHRFAGAAHVYRVDLADGITVEVTAVDRVADEGDRVAVRIVREPVAVVDP